MRAVFSTIFFIIFVGIFVHTIFMVAGIAPRTTELINANIFALVIEAPKTLFAQGETEQPVSDIVAVEEEGDAEPFSLQGTSTLERPIIVATTSTTSAFAKNEDEEYVGIVSTKKIGGNSNDAYHRQALGPEYTPVRVRIPAINVDTKVIVPTDTDSATLDQALTQGIVYYPDSGRVGKPGNAFLFGHSSWLPVVRNENFEVFNDLGKLKAGDTIIVTTTRNDFTYRVRSVRTADQDEIWVSFNEFSKALLTLSTCNSFGAKSERIVVEAELVTSS